MKKGLVGLFEREEGETEVLFQILRVRNFI